LTSTLNGNGTITERNAHTAAKKSKFLAEMRAIR
jgi:hypothetical protein